MAEIKLYLAEFDVNRKAATDIARAVAAQQTSQASLLRLVQSLNESLTCDDADERAKTIAFLAEVLAAVPVQVYSVQARNHLIDFLVSRMSADADGAGVSASANALIVMETKSPLSSDQACGFISSLLDKITPLQRVKRPVDRYHVLRLVDLVFRNYRQAITDAYTATPKLLPDLVRFFGGEKDPRNLMVVFSVLKVPMSEWQVQTAAQSLFECVFDYFPITFRPPPGDPYGITAQDLKDRLRECIGACSYFAPFAFSALTGKLESVSVNTRRDSLMALLECVTNYRPGYVAPYAALVWNSVKTEAINVQDDELARLAVAVLAQTATQVIADAELTGDNPAQAEFFTTVTAECEDHLQDAPTKQSKSATDLLERLSATSPGAASAIQAKMMPLIVGLVGGPTPAPRRRALLETVVQLVRANGLAFGHWAAAVPDQGRLIENPLETVKSSLFTVLVNTAVGRSDQAGGSHQTVAIEGLVQLASIRNLIEPAEMSSLISLLVEAALADRSTGPDLRPAAMDGLVAMAKQRPQLVIDHAFPVFLAALPTTNPDDETTYLAALDGFAQLGREAAVFDSVVIRLSSRIDEAVKQAWSSRYLQSLLSALLFALLSTNADLSNKAETGLFDAVVIPLIRHVVKSQQDSSPFLDVHVYDLVGRICMLVIRHQTAEFQKAHFQDEILPLVDYSDLGADLAESEPFLLRMTVATYVLAGVKRSVSPIENINRFLSLIVPVALDDRCHPFFHTTILKQISILLNKFVGPADIAAAITTTCHQPLQMFRNGDRKLDTMGVLFASIRALLLRNQAQATGLLLELVAMLADPDCGRAAAHAFSALLQPDDLLMKQNDCVVSPLSKQKAYCILCPALVEQVRTAVIGSEEKNNYAIALAGLVQWIPLEVLSADVGDLVPVLLQTLDLEAEYQAKLAALSTIMTLLVAQSAVVEQHAGSIVARLLACATDQPDKAVNRPVDPNGIDVRVRVAALECLRSVSLGFGITALVPFTGQVMDRLIIALDDRARRVRMAAVICRTRWAQLMEKVEEDD